MPPRPGEHHPAFEEYCETIYALEEDGAEVVQSAVAARLRVSRPAVSEMVRRMAAEGLVEVRGGSVHLTADGSSLAEQVVRRHRLAERFLVDVLGLGWGVAHHEAGKWEHVMSDNVEQAMRRVLGDPSTCPHGNPIPGSAHTTPGDTRPLAEVGPGEQVRIARIAEGLEAADGVLDFLEQHGVAPGVAATVASRAPDGTVTLAITPAAAAGATTVGLSVHVCEHIHTSAAR